MARNEKRGHRQRRHGAGRPAARTPAHELGPDKKSPPVPTSQPAKQAKFLKLYAEGMHTLEGAARQAAGVSASTIWRWRAADPEFDAQVKLVLLGLDGLRVQIVEDSMFQRLEKGTASAAEVIFFLCNRQPDRWRSVQRLEHTGAGGGPIRTADLSKLSQKELELFEGLLRKTGLQGATA